MGPTSKGRGGEGKGEGRERRKGRRQGRGRKECGGKEERGREWINLLNGHLKALISTAIINPNSRMENTDLPSLMHLA